MLLLAKAIFLITVSMVIGQFTYALAGRVVKVPIEVISLGVGWTLLRLGIVHIKIFPLSGYVKFKSLESEELTDEEANHALEMLPIWERLFIVSSALFVLLLLGLAIHGTEAWHWFLSTFRQYFTGAWGPMSTAQELIASFENDLRMNTLLYCFGLICVKQSALIFLFGWAQWVNMFTQKTEQITAWMWLFSTILIVACWLVALGYYFWQRLIP